MLGTPYSDETDIISDVKITTEQVSGYYTTNLNLTWQGDLNRVLCSYTEDFIRVGSVVYITPTAPICCCPKAYTSQAKTGNSLANAHRNHLDVDALSLLQQDLSCAQLEQLALDHTLAG